MATLLVSLVVELGHLKCRFVTLDCEGSHRSADLQRSTAAVRTSAALLCLIDVQR